MWQTSTPQELAENSPQDYEPFQVLFAAECLATNYLVDKFNCKW